MVRWIWMFGLVLAGCDEGVRYVGPGNGTPGGVGTTFGTGAGNTAAGACDAVEAGGECKRYTGIGWTAESAQADCVFGTWTDSGCPSGEIGSCTFDVGADQEYREYYYEPLYLAANAPLMEDECIFSGGGWTPGSGTSGDI